MPGRRLSPLLRRALLLPPLLAAVLLLSDGNDGSGDAIGDVNGGGNDDGLPRHAALLTALYRHPPSLRVFRALSEISLLLLCAAGCLRVWEGAGMAGEVGELLFGPVLGDEVQGQGRGGGSSNGNGSGSGSDGAEDWSVEDYEEDADGADGRGGEVELVEAGGGFRDAGGFMDAEGDMDMDMDAEEDGLADAPPAARGGGWVGPSSTSASSAGGPRPPPSNFLAGMAVDLLSAVLVCLFLFTLSSAEGGRYIAGLGGVPTGSGSGSRSLLPLPSPSSLSAAASATARLAAPVFPLLLFLYAALRSALPFRGRRRALWTCLMRTPMAPYKDVTFRDGLIGDVLTSAVRPLQDLAFTAFYVLSGLQGWWTAQYSIDEAGGPVERSWTVRTVVLPACVVSPLWWRFLQNLRQCRDARRRWPYLGNAFKYLLAAEVALFGLFEPDARQNAAWIACFVGATLYQVWWDVFMDWELLVRDNGGGKGPGPAASWPRYRLRPSRLYRSRSMYYAILAANFLLRFCWTATLIPRRYLSKTGMVRDAYSSDFQTFVGPALASAEIVRRAIWSLLRVELEAIKRAREKQGQGPSGPVEVGAEEDGYGLNDRGLELEPMQIGSGPRAAGFGRWHALNPVLGPYFAVMRRDMAEMTDLQILCELCLWATAFTSLGIFAAAHRQVM